MEIEQSHGAYEMTTTNMNQNVQYHYLQAFPSATYGLTSQIGSEGTKMPAMVMGIL